MTTTVNTDSIWSFLEEVMDPEVPVLNVVELGIIRNVELNEKGVNVTITPTYSGCPAIEVIEGEIRKCLVNKGFTEVKIISVLSPAWTTDWITEPAREKLRAYGIAPPEKTSADKGALWFRETKTIKCPHCNSEETEMRSQFGSTACKALYCCNSCREPFDYFKCL